jgi:hypothetical protein
MDRHSAGLERGHDVLRLVEDERGRETSPVHALDEGQEAGQGAAEDATDAGFDEEYAVGCRYGGRTTQGGYPRDTSVAPGGREDRRWASEVAGKIRDPRENFKPQTDTDGGVDLPRNVSTLTAPVILVRRIVATHTLFALLLAFNLVRTLHHAMWRDELQAFMIAANSPTLAELFARLHYECHPGLWYALLWVITRVTTDPTSMQIAQAAIAAATWLLIYRASPFDTREKFLLLAGYFLFFEYFVFSRSYGLMMLLGFAVVAVRSGRPRSGILPWLLLGLLANTVVYGTIWSIAMAPFVAAQQMRTDRRRLVAGLAAYVVLLALAVATMAPAPDQASSQAALGADASPLELIFAVPVDALAPLPVSWVKGIWALLMHPQTASFPRFWNPVPIYAIASLFGLGADHPGRVAAILVAAVVACAIIVRDRRLLAEFTLGTTASCC